MTVPIWSAGAISNAREYGDIPNGERFVAISDYEAVLADLHAKCEAWAVARADADANAEARDRHDLLLGMGDELADAAGLVADCERRIEEVPMRTYRDAAIALESAVYQWRTRTVVRGDAA